MLKLFDKIDENLSAIFLGAMTVITVIQIVFRYFISYSLSWPEELGRYLFIAAVYIGASYAEKENKHQNNINSFFFQLNIFVNNKQRQKNSCEHS